MWTSATCLRAYRAEIGASDVVPRADEEFALLLDVFLLEKAR